MPPLQQPGVSRPTQGCRFACEYVHNRQPLPLPFAGLRLGRQSAREAAFPFDAGTAVSRMAEEAVHLAVPARLQGFEPD